MTTDLTFDLKLTDRENPQALPYPIFDPEEYRSDLADLKLTEQQENEFLETLWAIMGTFARMGFTADVCGLIFGKFNEASVGDDTVSAPIDAETSSTDGGSI